MSTTYTHKDAITGITASDLLIDGSLSVDPGTYVVWDNAAAHGGVCMPIGIGASPEAAITDGLRQLRELGVTVDDVAYSEIFSDLNLVVP